MDWSRMKSNVITDADEIADTDADEFADLPEGDPRLYESEDKERIDSRKCGACGVVLTSLEDQKFGTFDDPRCARCEQEGS